ncbi:MAG TPA: ASCH domain-containing protein [Tepidisphaeraceae bacterium]|jgi:hypothetical protein|nr:ASCH domain-containing protein [Tepidisphaeraceae bacterium]
MPQLLFKKQFVDSIRRGTKTTTLRRWKYARLHPGSRAFVPGVGWLKILSCQRIEQSDLTLADAKTDGFASLKSLMNTLREIYPNHDTDGRFWYRVAFELAELASPSSPVTPKSPMKTASDRPTPAAIRRKTARRRLARRIRADLDKAVRQSGSLFPL